MPMFEILLMKKRNLIYSFSLVNCIWNVTFPY